MSFRAPFSGAKNPYPNEALAFIPAGASAVSLSMISKPILEVVFKSLNVAPGSKIFRAFGSASILIGHSEVFRNERKVG
jgi:hypothetical protein